jgi:hypothetical protein
MIIFGHHFDSTDNLQDLQISFEFFFYYFAKSTRELALNFIHKVLDYKNKAHGTTQMPLLSEKISSGFIPFVLP